MSPDHVFQFEKLITDQAAGLLRAAGAGDADTVRTQFDDRPYAVDAKGVELPRIEIEASPFSKASGQKAYTAQGVAFYNHYRGQFAIEMTTPRKGGAALHNAWLGLARRIFSMAAVPDFRPYCLLEIEEAAGSITLVKEGERDRSRLVFSIQIGIPSGLVDYAATLPLPPIATS